MFELRVSAKDKFEGAVIGALYGYLMGSPIFNAMDAVMSGGSIFPLVTAIGAGAVVAFIIYEKWSIATVAQARARYNETFNIK